MPVVLIDGASLLMLEQFRDDMQASAAQLITDMGNENGIDVTGQRVVVVSSKGYNSEVTGVRVGRVLDTMRSRRRSLPETYDPVTPVDQAT
jgi:hypothetical protein